MYIYQNLEITLRLFQTYPNLWSGRHARLYFWRNLLMTLSVIMCVVGFVYLNTKVSAIAIWVFAGAFFLTPIIDDISKSVTRRKDERTLPARRQAWIEAIARELLAIPPEHIPFNRIGKMLVEDALAVRREVKRLASKERTLQFGQAEKRFHLNRLQQNQVIQAIGYAGEALKALEELEGKLGLLVDEGVLTSEESATVASVSNMLAVSILELEPLKKTEK